MTRSEPAPSRIIIESCAPLVAQGAYPAKRVVGEPIEVGATVFAEGHDRLHVVAAHRAPGERTWTESVMTPVNPGLDRWAATIIPDRTGLHQIKVRAWVDHVGTWLDGTGRKVDAHLDVTSELLAGAALLDELTTQAPPRSRPVLQAAADALRSGDVTLVTDGSGRLERVAHTALRPGDATTGPTMAVDVERERALFSTWYELFPRSLGRGGRSGTLRDVADQLEELAELGIDVLYLPPVHPIGRSFRKGPDNVETAGPDDPGSPWAIGGPEGGHTAVHPDLGTVEDVCALAAAAADCGIELALDLAFQCSPDHPWVTEHPEWFRHRPDGSIQYAENPPKKYQDIYPLDFEGPAWRSLWEALAEVTEFWIDHGVHIFRVDNPHTKPFAFWEWLIARIRGAHPEVIFLAEAFTRPAVMRHLGQLGFTQGYTYFTWRTSAEDLTEYFTELSTPPSVDEFRPNAWPTTPDILPWQLQGAPIEAFAVRLALAATLSPSYGVYGPGFELGDHVSAMNGKEEFGASEKYEIRRWDTAAEPSLRPLMRRINEIRFEQQALHTLRTLRFHGSDNPLMLTYSKTAHAGPQVNPARPGECTILVVVNLDPTDRQATTLRLDLAALGVDGRRPFDVEDLLGGERYRWSGDAPYVELDPHRFPAHVLRVTQSPETA